MEQLLKDFDLVEIRKKRNEDLSIGQRRRVQVAREFMHDMELLFLDEPTVGLFWYHSLAIATYRDPDGYPNYHASTRERPENASPPFAVVCRLFWYDNP